jgi:hypothetical protein
VDLDCRGSLGSANVIAGSPRERTADGTIRDGTRMPAAVDLSDESGIVGIGSGTGRSPLGNSLVGRRVRAGVLGALAPIQAEYGGDTMIRGAV